MFWPKSNSTGDATATFMASILGEDSEFLLFRLWLNRGNLFHILPKPLAFHSQAHLPRVSSTPLQEMCRPKAMVALCIHHECLSLVGEWICRTGRVIYHGWDLQTPPEVLGPVAHRGLARRGHSKEPHMEGRWDGRDGAPGRRDGRDGALGCPP